MEETLNHGNLCRTGKESSKSRNGVTVTSTIWMFVPRCRFLASRCCVSNDGAVRSGSENEPLSAAEQVCQAMAFQDRMHVRNIQANRPIPSKVRGVSGCGKLLYVPVVVVLEVT
jgi:hypothetical protein